MAAGSDVTLPLPVLTFMIATLRIAFTSLGSAGEPLQPVSASQSILPSPSLSKQSSQAGLPAVISLPPKALVQPLSSGQSVKPSLSLSSLSLHTGHRPGPSSGQTTPLN